MGYNLGMTTLVTPAIVIQKPRVVVVSEPAETVNVPLSSAIVDRNYIDLQSNAAGSGLDQ